MVSNPSELSVCVHVGRGRGGGGGIRLAIGWHLL